MSAREDMAQLLEQWLQLAQAEGAAIRLAAWPDVKKIQARKPAMQKSFAEAVRKWAEENSFSSPPPFHAEVRRLISLVTRNGEALAAHLRRAREQQVSLDCASQTLHKVQRSYVRPLSLTAWQSYS